VAHPPEDQDATPPRGRRFDLTPPARPVIGKGQKIIAAVAAVAGIAAAGVFLYVNIPGDHQTWSGDETRIRVLVKDFATAVDTEDQAGLVRLLCAEEAAGITDDDDYNPADDSAAAEPQIGQLSVQTSDIHVTGDTASAQVARAADEPRTLYFRKEQGAWKVCAPAAGPPARSTTPTSR
jgi:ketosteroid isomerase-like protein